MFNHSIHSVLLLLVSIISLSICDGSVYYKNPNGAVFGPFSFDQVYKWWMDGFFSEEVPTSSHPSSGFVSMREFFLIGAAESEIIDSKHNDYDKNLAVLHKNDEDNTLDNMAFRNNFIEEDENLVLKDLPTLSYSVKSLNKNVDELNEAWNDNIKKTAKLNQYTANSNKKPFVSKYISLSPFATVSKNLRVVPKQSVLSKSAISSPSVWSTILYSYYILISAMTPLHAGLYGIYVFSILYQSIVQVLSNTIVLPLTLSWLAFTSVLAQSTDTPFKTKEDSTVALYDLLNCAALHLRPRYLLMVLWSHVKHILLHIHHWVKQTSNNDISLFDGYLHVTATHGTTIPAMQVICPPSHLEQISFSAAKKYTLGSLLMLAIILVNRISTQYNSYLENGYLCQHRKVSILKYYENSILKIKKQQNNIEKHVSFNLCLTSLMDTEKILWSFVKHTIKILSSVLSFILISIVLQRYVFIQQDMHSQLLLPFKVVVGIIVLELYSIRSLPFSNFDMEIEKKSSLRSLEKLDESLVTLETLSSACRWHLLDALLSYRNELWSDIFGTKISANVAYTELGSKMKWYSVKDTLRQFIFTVATLYSSILSLLVYQEMTSNHVQIFQHLTEKNTIVWKFLSRIAFFSILSIPYAVWSGIATHCTELSSLYQQLHSSKLFRLIFQSNLDDSNDPLNSKSQLQAPLEGEESDGWAADGPHPSDGVHFDGVTILGGGKVKIRDATLHFKTGNISVVCGDSGSGKTSLLEAIWNEYSNSLSVKKGTIWVHGRELNEWNMRYLRSRKILYNRKDEVILPVTKGMIISSYINAKRVSSDKWKAICHVTGVNPILESLDPQTSCATLHFGDYKKLLLCRTLLLLDNKEIVLLDEPTAHMSDREEKLLFDYLRSTIQPHQIVIVTSARDSSATYADCSFTCDDGVFMENEK